MRSVFLTPACCRCQLIKTGRGCLLSNRGLLPAQGAPHGAPSRASQLTGPRGPGVAFRHPRVGDFCSLSALRDPPLPACSTQADRHGTPYSLYRGRRFLRTTLLQHARRRSDRASRTSTTNVASIRAPAAAASGVGSKRPVVGSSNRMIGEARPDGDSVRRHRIGSRLTPLAAAPCHPGISRSASGLSRGQRNIRDPGTAKRASQRVGCKSASALHRFTLAAVRCG